MARPNATLFTKTIREQLFENPDLDCKEQGGFEKFGATVASRAQAVNIYFFFLY